MHAISIVDLLAIIKPNRLRQSANNLLKPGVSGSFQQGLYVTITSMAYDNGHDEEQPHVCDMARKDDR